MSLGLGPVEEDPLADVFLPWELYPSSGEWLLPMPVVPVSI